MAERLGRVFKLRSTLPTRRGLNPGGGIQGHGSLSAQNWHSDAASATYSQTSRGGGVSYPRGGGCGQLAEPPTLGSWLLRSKKPEYGGWLVLVGGPCSQASPPASLYR